MAVPMASSAKGVAFGVFQRRIASFRVTGFITCRESFSEDALYFSWQAQHFGDLHRDFAWQAQHFRRVVLRGFYKSRCQGCVKWRQGANSVAGVAFCEM